MITLDRIKIIAPLECVTITRQEAFEVTIKNDAIISMSYTQTSPCKLYVEVDYKECETVIEFSGKILMDAYPELINKDNIGRCFDHINRMGFCRVDVDMVLEYGKVCSMDVTKDVPCTDVAALSEWLRTHIVNHRKYLARNIGGNLTIEKNVRTKAYRRRLTVYDKEKELRRADNQDFMASLTDPECLLSYFKGRIRFEYNLNTKQSIRQVLNIGDTTINSILGSDARPIYDFVNDVISEDREADSACLSWTDRKNLALLRDCNMDLSKVETEIRTYASKGSHLSQMIKPYRELWSRINGKRSEFKTNLLGLLLETTIMLPLLLVW